jgi:hypothetical protein
VAFSREYAAIAAAAVSRDYSDEMLMKQNSSRRVRPRRLPSRGQATDRHQKYTRPRQPDCRTPIADVRARRYFAADAASSSMSLCRQLSFAPQHAAAAAAAAMLRHALLPAPLVYTPLLPRFFFRWNSLYRIYLYKTRPLMDDLPETFTESRRNMI